MENKNQNTEAEKEHVTNTKRRTNVVFFVQKKEKIRIKLFRIAHLDANLHHLQWLKYSFVHYLKLKQLKKCSKSIDEHLENFIDVIRKKGRRRRRTNKKEKIFNWNKCFFSHL